MPDSLQFDGTFGSAKAVVAWIGDPAKAHAGPWDHFQAGDADRGGLDLISQVADAPFYTSVNATDWVVQADDKFVVFTAEQYAVAFPG